MSSGHENASTRGIENDSAIARMGANMELFLGHGIREIGAFVPDALALRAAGARIVMAAGEASHNQLAHRCATALAERLGTDVIDFPGDHGGFLTQPDAFAARLLDVLEMRRRRGLSAPRG
jgi:hypothetical protein